MLIPGSKKHTSHDKRIEEAASIDANEEPREIFETKYWVPRRARNLVLATLRLKALMPEQFAKAKVKTIYFDDRAQTSFLDSKDGFLQKEKYRLREYIDSVDGARYSLEIKLRSDTKTSKIRKLIFKGLPADYRVTTFRALLDTFERENSFSLSWIRRVLPMSELFFSTTIYYERFRFDDPMLEARYNLDTKIMLSPSQGSEMKLREGVYLDHDIFEIKSAAPMGLPAFLSGLDIEPVTFSKFAWGNELLQ